MIEDAATRRRTMQAVKSGNTKPEMLVRRIAHKAGYRYRIHKTGLPGKPDLVFASRCKVIFVHGCFWHGHACKRGARTPSTNQTYWTEKIRRNRLRDEKIQRQLSELGWSVLTIWECETSNAQDLLSRIHTHLGAPGTGTIN